LTLTSVHEDASIIAKLSFVVGKPVQSTFATLYPAPVTLVTLPESDQVSVGSEVERELFENDMGAPCLKILFSDPLWQGPDDTEDFLVVISKSCFGIRIRSWETSDIAIVLLVRRMKRWGGFDIRVRSCWTRRQ